MRNIKISKKLVSVCLLFTVIVGCQDDQSEVFTDVDATAYTEEIQSDIAYIRFRGFTNADIVYVDTGFVVDYDIFISKQQVDEFRSVLPNGKVQQRRYTWGLMDPYLVKDIKVAFQSGSNDVGQEWRNAFDQAIDAWNNSGSAVRFRKVPYSTSHDIVIYKNNGVNVNNVPVGALASWPSLIGTSGPTIQVNVESFNGQSFAKKARVAAHELGHTIGLTHTDIANEGLLIEGTPDGESGSVMELRPTAVTPLLTYFDKVAVQILYATNNDGPGVLTAGQTLFTRKPLMSENRRFILLLQNDGSLVVYENSSGTFKALWWASGTYGKPVQKLVMQSDGNLVLYSTSGHALWSTGTYSTPANRLVMQNDGNLVLYDNNGQVYWSSR
jgi:hypothetical protein